MHFNTDQSWYYLPNQQPTEILIFKNADSQEHLGASLGKRFELNLSIPHDVRSGGTNLGVGCPHASFDNLKTKDADFKRESIEFRVLVRL